jgi:hypothetical protein
MRLRGSLDLPLQDLLVLLEHRVRFGELLQQFAFSRLSMREWRPRSMALAVSQRSNGFVM